MGDRDALIFHLLDQMKAAATDPTFVRESAGLLALVMEPPTPEILADRPHIGWYGNTMVVT